MEFKQVVKFCSPGDKGEKENFFREWRKYFHEKKGAYPVRNTMKSNRTTLIKEKFDAALLTGVFFWTSIGLVTGDAQSYLSGLWATGNDPLYTTYAAPLNRSQFIIDQGYHLYYSEPGRGITLSSEAGGELKLALKFNGEVRYLLEQMTVPPVITTSYSDVVKYQYQPFENILLEVFFHVYSSRIAIQEITVQNLRSDSIHLDLYPFFQHPGVLEEVAIGSVTPYFSFLHTQPPDAWTVTHGIPYKAVRRNVLLISEAPDGFGSYTQAGEPPLPYSVPLSSQEEYCVEWGPVFHADGSPCNHTPPQAQQLILHNNSWSEALTEESPGWGNGQPNIPGTGYQSAELGNFRIPPIAIGDSFTVVFSCLATGGQGITGGRITSLPAPGGIYTPVQIADASFPPAPENVQVAFAQNFTSAVISWNGQPGVRYSVYRRSGSRPGRYDRIADNLIWPGYQDSNLNPDSSYGFIVIARDSSGATSPHSLEVGSIPSPSFFQDLRNVRLYNQLTSFQPRVVAFQKSVDLAPGETHILRLVRGLSVSDGNPDSLVQACQNVLSFDLQQALAADEQWYSNIPRLNFQNADEEMMYWSAFNLMRQSMLPPEGQCSYNYYVFSREPQWGWGHGGQVFHESLTMLAYVFIDPLSALNSQRVYMDRQWPNGYINYRTGPYLNETIPYSGQYTSAAPWFNWENWEIFQVYPDTTFLVEAYQSGKRFYQFWVNERDADNDGLAEWGGHAVLESVRDGQVAVWDQVAWPANFECLDLNSLLVMEARALAEMAVALGLNDEAQQWFQQARARSDSINKYMWDEASGFYYHVDKLDHDFSFNAPGDLKRQEIIGFLPLWAGVADSSQAARLVQHLTNPAKFWRNFGVPTLAADDPYYNPLGYWNGPVWIPWQYLVFRGLLNTGYEQEARQLAEKVFANVIRQLKENHWFWELYSPDAYQAGWNRPYIWSGLVARMLIDLQNIPTSIAQFPEDRTTSQELILSQNYPNPFNRATRITYSLPGPGRVQLRIFDLQGRVVRNLLDGNFAAGFHTLEWDGRNGSGRPVSSGIYFYRLEAPGVTMVRKMIVLR